MVTVLIRITSLVDQPAGTGFSYTSSNHYLHELPDVRSIPIFFVAWDSFDC